MRAIGAAPPVEAYGQVPAITDIDINPAGTRLVWIENSDTQRRLVVFDLAGHRVMRVMASPAETVLRSAEWADDETLLVSASVTHSYEGPQRNAMEWGRWFSIPAVGGEPRMLLMQGGFREYTTGATLVRRSTAKPGKIFMSTWDWNGASQAKPSAGLVKRGRLDSGEEYNLYEVDLKTGKGKTLEHGGPFTERWTVDPSGAHIVRTDWNPTQEKFVLQVKDGSSWRRLYEAGRCGHLGSVVITPDGSAVVAIGTRCNEERAKLWSIPLDGSPMTVLVEDAALDVDDVYTDDFDDTLLYAQFAGAGHKRHWLDANAERRRKGLIRSFNTDWVSIYGRSADGQKIVVNVEGASRPPVFHIVDYGAKRADIINEAYPRLAGITQGTVREFEYQARDKYALMAYLTLPADTTAKTLPVVVLPHGGPEARDDGGFDWIAQFLASRGYAVLQPQFRGSSGFGKAHADAGRRQWGLRMQDDVTDGVRALIDQGIADPRRICIAGASYGGYSALAGAAFTPELYACAVSISGVSDLPSMIGYDTRMSMEESSSTDYWHEHIGPATDPQVIARSPARSAATFRAPVLLIHGTEDTVVPIEQSRLMAHALQASGKPVELIELPGEDHWLSQSATRIRMLTELERFLAKYLPAESAAQAKN
ncbi:MAG TPA: S9 family peptidase [Steroidobacteraceae bacterium]|nr:S9 family peptidase [Steroidobacteraceae bacterium]